LDGCGESVTDGFGGVAVGEGKQHHIPGPAFHQSADGGLSASYEKIAFPMTGHRPVLDLGGPF